MRSRVPLLIPVVLLCAGSLSAQQATNPQRSTLQTGRAAQPPQRVRLAPQFVPGHIFRYQMDFRTTTESHRAGVVEDPQAASQLEISWGGVVRVEVLSVESAPATPGPGNAAAGTPSRARLRTTYEKVDATARSDSYDPEAAAIAEQYRKLGGRAITFTLGADGKVGAIEGLDEIVADRRAAEATRDWLSQLAVGASAPQGGIALGQKWSSELPATGAPVAGLFWRTDSTYLRNERCRTLENPAASATLPSAESCAVILTRFEIVQPRPVRDPTPEEYRKRGLRTAGKWSGSGETLSYVSLRSGWVVSITQSGTEEMDVTISLANGASSVRYAGRVRSQSQITLLPESSAPGQ